MFKTQTQEFSQKTDAVEEVTLSLINCNHNAAAAQYIQQVAEIRKIT